MQPVETLAFCLKATPYRETDSIVWLYTREFGTVRAVAKGVRKANSKLAGACEPLTLNQVSITTGKDLKTLCQYERKGSFQRVRDTLERLAVGNVMTELIRLTARENDPDSPAIYDFLSQYLEALNDPEQPWESVSLAFQMNMLKLTGYGLLTGYCAHCQDILDLESAPFYPFALEVGGWLCPTCKQTHHWRNTVNVSSATIQALETSYPADKTASRNAHRFLAYYWETRLEHPLQSYPFLLGLF